MVNVVDVESEPLTPDAEKPDSVPSVTETVTSADFTQP